MPILEGNNLNNQQKGAGFEVKQDHLFQPVEKLRSTRY